MKKFDLNKWSKNNDMLENSSKAFQGSSNDYNDIEKVIEEIEQKRIDIAPSYDQWLRVGFAFAHSFSEDGRELFHRVSRFHLNYSPRECDEQYSKCLKSTGNGVTINTFYHYAKEAGCGRSKIATSNLHKPSSYKNELVDIESDLVLTSDREIIAGLSQYFIFIPEHQILFKRFKDGTIDYSNYFKYSDLYFELKDLKIRGLTKAIFEYMLKSKSIKNITPLHVFCDMVMRSEWDGTDYIERLFKAIKVTRNYDANLKLFRKWIVNVYAFGLRGIDPDLPRQSFLRVALIFFSHARGLGKTAFFRKLGLSSFFEELTKIPGFEIYAELTGDLGVDERRISLLLESNLILNIDDIQEMLINSTGKLRSIISSDSLTDRPLYTDGLKKMDRRAAICGSTNHGEILRKDDENRYLVMEIEEIMDFNAINSIDYLQLWAQARAEFFLDTKGSVFNNDDLQNIMSLSSEYTYQSPEEQAIQTLFEYSLEPEEELTFRDIVGYLEAFNFRFNHNKLGSVLKSLAPDGKIYKKKNGGSMRVYLLNKKSSDHNADDDLLSSR